MNTTFSLRNISSATLLAVIVGFGFLAVSCGDDENVGSTESGKILVSPDPVNFAQVPLGTTAEKQVLVGNVEDSPLTVFDIELEEIDGFSKSGLELVDVPETPFEIEGEDRVTITVKYTPEEGSEEVRAKLAIASSDARFTREEPKSVNVTTLANAPKLQVRPERGVGAVRFAPLPPGEKDTQNVTITNVGTAPLTIWKEPEYGGGADFRIDVPERSYPITLDVYDEEKAVANPDDYRLEFDVTYAPRGEGANSGQIVIESNDPSGEDRQTQDGEVRARTTVDVEASLDRACIQIDGTTRNFGQVPIGSASSDVVTIENCGSQTLEVESIHIGENSEDNEFELDLGGLDTDDSGDIDSTLRLDPAEEETFVLKYTPVQAGTDRGQIIIVSNDSFQRELEVDLVGRGSEGICPVAKAGAYVKGISSTPRQTLSANPLDYVVIDGSASSDEDGAVVDYEWTVVEKPDGAIVNLGPTDQDPLDEDKSKRQLRLLVAGKYVIDLKVRDNDGFESCGDAARVSILATPNEKVHVELTWTNPEDPDETDDVGSDVDVHLVKMGPGKWFETPYDIYFRNPNNSAGAENNGLWNPESPSLDIDDRDGGGPENIQMNDPANCEWYAVGVHYYRQIFGTAYVTVRVYINAQLVYEKVNRPLTEGGQFWDVARIHWDSGQVFDVDNILEAAPASTKPEVSTCSAGETCMSTSGLCTSQDLYMVQ